MLALQRSLETELFRMLNQFVEPLVRAGVGSPGLCPVGAIVLEMTGRVTGRRVSVPLVAALIGDIVVVSTAHPRSQWIRNVAAHPDVRYWLLGRPRDASAVVVSPGRDTSTRDGVPDGVRWLVGVLRPYADALRVSFALLAPPTREGHADA